jgi:aminoglycoside phosphotransferase (APT) family kinase protein
VKTINTKSKTNPNTLLVKIHDEFPSLTWDTYKYIASGWDHEVIVLDNSIVFRFPNDNEYRASLAIEIKVLRQLQTLVQASIPNYTFVARDMSFAGYPIVAGEALSKSRFYMLSETDREVIAKQLANLLSSLHMANDKGLDSSKVASSYMPNEQAEVKALASKHLPKALSKDDYRIVEVILEQVDDLLLKSNPISFIHGDVYSDHLLWDEQHQKLGLIDFSDMSIADPAIDFAELYEYGKSFMEIVYQHYTAPKDKTFLQRAWIYQRWIGVFMMTDYFVHSKTSFNVARQTFDGVKTGLISVS